MRALTAVLVLVDCGCEGRRFRPEQPIRTSASQQQHEKTEPVAAESPSDTGTATPGGSKTPGTGKYGRLKATAVLGLTAGASRNLGAGMALPRTAAGRAHDVTQKSSVNYRGQAGTVSRDPVHRSDGHGGLFPGLLADTADHHVALHESGLPPAHYDSTLIQQKSPLSVLSATKDVYDLASGELLFLMKDGANPSELENQHVALNAVEQEGINVVSHTLVTVKHPVTGAPVLGLVKANVPEVTINIAADPKAAEKIVNKVETFHQAVNLQADIEVLYRSIMTGLRITKLKGAVKSDGHFVVTGTKGVMRTKKGLLTKNILSTKNGYEAWEFIGFEGVVDDRDVTDDFIEDLRLEFVMAMKSLISVRQALKIAVEHWGAQNGRSRSAKGNKKKKTASNRWASSSSSTSTSAN